MPGSSEANKDLIRNLLADADRGESDVVDRYYASDYVDHTPSPVRRQAPGREGVRQAVTLAERWAEHGLGVLEQLGITPTDAAIPRENPR